MSSFGPTTTTTPTTPTPASNSKQTTTSLKTPHRSRRRKVPPVVRADDKENNCSHHRVLSQPQQQQQQQPQQQPQQLGGKHKPSVAELLDDGNVIFGKEEGDQADTNDDSSSSSRPVAVAETLVEFRSALSKVASLSLLSSSLFSQHSSLDERVVRLSLNLNVNVNLRQQQHPPSNDPAVVREHATALLSLARKLIKQAVASATTTEKKKKNEDATTTTTTTTANLLLIAVHSLRAVVAVVAVLQKEEEDRDESSSSNISQMMETCIRLLYHLMTTASERFQQQQSQNNQKSSQNDHNKFLGLIVMAGYEALQMLLLHYSCYRYASSSSSQTTKPTRIVRFRSSRAGTQEEEEDGNLTAVLVVPYRTTTQQTSTTTTTTTTVGSMTLRQIATIAFKACLACVSARYQLWQQDSHVDGRGVEAAAPRYGDLARFLLVGRPLSSQSISQSSSTPSSSSLLVQPLDSIVQLLHAGYRPWLSFLAAHCSSDDHHDDHDADHDIIDIRKELPTHCKTAHRLLWEYAAKLKGTWKNDDDDDDAQVEDTCLVLRWHAIEMLLPVLPCSTSDTTTTTTSQQDYNYNSSPQQQPCWEAACGYAWKAASVYVQQGNEHGTVAALPVALDTALGQFHATVGPLLENNDRTTHMTMSSVSFVEYCVYRALHCGIPPKLHSCYGCFKNSSSISTAAETRCWRVEWTNDNDRDNDREKDGRSTIGALVLSVALLGVQSIHQLSSEQGCRSSDEEDQHEDPQDCSSRRCSSYLWDLVAAFESSVIPQWASVLPEETQSRYFKLLSSTLSLHRTLFHALKKKDNHNSDSSPQKQQALEVASVVLNRCIGPLALAMAKNTSKVSSAMFELAVECYIRPLAAFERLSETCETGNEEERYRSLANETIQAMHRLFFAQQDFVLPTGHLEKCAKSIALVARQRTDRSRTRASIVPTLYSIPMYQYLSNNKNNSSDYQVSARLAHLANAMQSSGFYHLALAVLACVIAQELPNCYEDDSRGDLVLEEWTDIEVLHFLAARSKNVFSPSSTTSTDCHPTALARSSIRRLIAVKQQLVKEQSITDPAKYDASTQQAWNAFLMGSGGISSLDNMQDILSSSSVALLLPKILQWQQPKGDEPTRASWTLRSCLVYVDAMVELGASMQGDLPETEESLSQTTWQVEDCLALGRHLESELIPQLKSSHDFLPVLVKVVVSTTLTNSKMMVDFSRIDNDNERSIDAAIELAHDAMKVLESLSPNANEKGEVCTQLLTAVVSRFCYHIEARRGETTDVELFQHFQKAMAAFRTEATSQSSDAIHEFCRKSFLWTLSHFQIQLESSGDSIRSVIAMHWVLEVLDESDPDECAWFRSTAISSFLASPLSKTTDIPHEIPQDCYPRSMEWFAQTELSLASLRAQISAAGADSQAISKRAKSIKSEIKATETSTDKRDIISQWVVCSVELTLAECAASAGSFTEALKHLQESCRQCMAVVSSARFSAGNSGDSPLWENVARSTLHSRANKRYAELLGLRSQLYSRIGDHRKAISYLSTLADFLGIDLGHVNKESGPNVESMLGSGSDLGSKAFRRLNAEIRCSASSIDLVANNLEGMGLRWPQEAWSESNDVSRQLQLVLDVMSVGDLVYGESIKSPFQSSFPEFYKEALDWYTFTISSSNLFEAYRSLANHHSTTMSAKVAIREIRCLLHLKSMLDPDIRSKVRALCEEVLENVAADAIDRAWAQYYTADLEIAVLRQSGGLARLWSLNGDEICEQEDEVRLRTARDHLTKAAISHAIGSDILSRIILRNLALVAGPETDCISNASSGSLVLMSIGQSYRQLMIRSLSDANDGTSKRVQDLLDLFSICEKSGIHESGKGVVRLLAHLAEVVPSNWKFVAATLCPSGDLLVTSIEKVPDVGEMRMKTSLIEPKTGDNAYDDILVPLDEIIRESQSQLYGMDVSAVSERFSKEAAKREWWDNRHKLDEDLQALLETVESSHFPSLHLKTDSGDCIFQSAESMSLPIGNLASKFEAAVEETKCREETAESLQKLTVPKLKERLRDEFGFTDSKFRKMKKQDLIDLILSESNARSQQIEDVPSDGCLFLILDENLHRFPFEGMPSLVGHSVCRVPSLSFILASLLERNVSQPGQTHLVDPARASFVLDPESNLVSTRKRLKPVLDGIAIEHDWDWDSAVGQIPNASFFEDGLIRQDGLFMYFGHGGAQTCYSRKQVENLMCERDGHGARACNATVILMGCSSGRLVSVNRKHSQALEQIPLYYEPEGIALSYLCAGAPCVVGNLWDVTDHDIDRYSTTLLEKFLQGDGGKSLASCVATSRSACKLRFIVGCAPVCYGVPVHLQTIN